MFRFIRCLENTSTFRHPTHSAFSWKWVQMKGNGFVSSLKSENSSSSTLWLKVNGGTEGETRENEAPVLVGIKMYVPPIRRRQMWTISETNQGKSAPRAFANHTHSHTLICLTCSNSHKEETDTVKPNLSLSPAGLVDRLFISWPCDCVCCLLSTESLKYLRGTNILTDAEFYCCLLSRKVNKIKSKLHQRKKINVAIKLSKNNKPLHGCSWTKSSIQVMVLIQSCNKKTKIEAVGSFIYSSIIYHVFLCRVAGGAGASHKCCRFKYLTIFVSSWSHNNLNVTLIRIRPVRYQQNVTCPNILKSVFTLTVKPGKKQTGKL